MSNDGARVRGAAELSRTLGELADTLDDLSATSSAAADLIVGAARGYAPVLTGRLRASIRGTADRAGATVTAGEGITSPYPAVQEYGLPRHNIVGRRYMARAAETTERAVVNKYENDLSTAVNNVRGA